MAKQRATFRRDANHTEIVGHFESLGCSVQDLAGVGNDCPDILIGCAGVDQLVEIKTESGTLETGQERFAREWRGRPPKVARTLDDCISIVQEIRRGLKR